MQLGRDLSASRRGSKDQSPRVPREELRVSARQSEYLHMLLAQSDTGALHRAQPLSDHRRILPDSMPAESLLCIAVALSTGKNQPVKSMAVNMSMAWLCRWVCTGVLIHGR